MKKTFERLLQENIKAFIERFKYEPDENELQEIRNITHTQIAFILAVKLQNNVNDFIDFCQNV